MNTSLEDQIRNTPEAFDNALPPVGHFERFEQRLERHEKKKNFFRYRWIAISSVAAVAAFLLMLQYTSPIHSTKAHSPESVEVASFYNCQLEEEISKIEKQVNTLDPNTRQELMKDIQNMKEEAQELSKQPKNMQEEDKIANIVLRYNLQMESLQHIQSIIQNIPNRKTNKF